jgi:hypothetical protein
MEDKLLVQLLQKEMAFEESAIFSMEELLEKWGQYFNSLIENDFHQLISLLYRIDVSEHKLRRMLRENPSENAGKMIASLMVERLLQKIRSREEHRAKRDTMTEDPDAETW